MNPVILVVEDNTDLLFSIELILKTNNYDVVTANNGLTALSKLKDLELIPDIILSDIMMPDMNGYEFFKSISNNSIWNNIPFIFISARSSPEDIRLGRLLGADDYITKPLNEKDLLAVISGKINRKNRNILLTEKINEALTAVSIDLTLTPLEEQETCVMIAFWDDRFGPELKDYYPREKIFPLPLDSIVNQLFSATTSIYGQDKITKAEGILLNIKNLNQHGYLYFDSYPDKSERFEEKEFMIAIIAPKISYFHSLNLREILISLSKLIKTGETWDVIQFWRKIQDVLSS